MIKKHCKIYLNVVKYPTNVASAENKGVGDVFPLGVVGKSSQPASLAVATLTDQLISKFLFASGCVAEYSYCVFVSNSSVPRPV